MPNLRVAIVDEDLDSRVTLRRALQRAELELLGETGYGTEAISATLQTRPDVIFLAVEEPAARALDTVEGLVNELPETPVVVYSSDGNAESVRRAMIAGARDYVLKPVESARMIEAVRTALDTEERRRMRGAGKPSAPTGHGTVITVAGAKGGIGKSVLSVNLAVALRAETGRSVLIVDADTQFGDVATMLDVTPQLTVRELLLARRSVDRNSVREYVSVHSMTGVDILAASEEEGAWDDCDAEDIRHILELFAQVYDFIVVDTSGSMDRLVHACIDASTLTLVVSSGEVSAVRDTAAAVRRMEKWGVDPERVRYVLNARTADQGIVADELSQAIGRPVFWTVPHDRGVVEAVQIGYPIVLRGSDTKAGQSIAGLARRVSGKDSGSSDAQRVPMWRRVVPLRGRGASSDDADTERFRSIIQQR